MQLAQRNSLESPLLRLPGEIRYKIWKHALGDHLIDIQYLSHEVPMDNIWDINTVYPSSTLVPPGFVRPTFQLPEVCRQIYLEASPYIYTLNTFAFHSLLALDKWIKNRCLGQRRLIASLDVPRTYVRLYRSGLRKTFRSKFPNIERIGIDNWTLFCEYDESRRLHENKLEEPLKLWEDAKVGIVGEVQRKEGGDVFVAWHGNSS
ncbi:hypothetical protein N0V94_000430 [Neodidymelliopsis sp. IMI 364377]|nr:hypothetical protein N0V94_000430 [Neodidymelliopsis sp. IMI 364377]